MYHAFWFDEDGDPYHLEYENLADLVAALGGEDAAKALFLQQYQPQMCHGAILIQGNELLWDIGGPATEYSPEDFTPGDTKDDE